MLRLVPSAAPSGFDRELRKGLAVLLGAACLTQGIAIAYNLFAFDPPNVGADSALFQYVGWYGVQGGIPYRTVWDIKPPLIHEVATGLALIGGGDPYRIHILSISLMAFTFLGTVFILVVVTYDLTDSANAALGAGAMLFTFPQMYTFASQGLRPKGFVLFFGLLAMWAYVRDWPLVAGGAAAVAAGFWQLGIVFPALVVGGYALNGNRRGVLLASVMIAIVGSITVWPFIARGSIDVLITQAVIAPLVTTEKLPLGARIIQGGLVLKLAAPFVVASTIGILSSYRYKRAGWVLGGSVWWILQVFLLDFDSAPDLFTGFVFAAIGFGILLSQLDRRRRRQILLLISVVVAVMFVWGASDGRLGPKPGIADDPDSVPYKYWNEVEAETCHIRMSPVEQQFVRIMDGSVRQPICTGWNDGLIDRL